MSNDTNKSQALSGELQATEVHRAEIVFHEGPLMLPNGMTPRQAMKLLREREAFMNETVSVTRTFDAFVWDGALALQRALTARFGWAPSRKTRSMFGDNPPRLIEIEVDYKKTEQVPWGRFGIPGVDEGFIETGYEWDDGQVMFSLEAEVYRKDEHLIRDIFKDVADQLESSSIYMGKAISVRFKDDDGDRIPLPTVKFMPTDIKPENLILSRDLEAVIETNLLTPIRRAEDCEANDIPVKRGVLLGGQYGTGKTLAAAVAAHEAVANGVTYIYVPRADELKDAIAFSRRYTSPAAVVFCEDIDRVTEGKRSVRMDDLLNIIDGIDGKRSNIIVVMTTNFLDNINPAMLRPGRLDAVIEVTPPDAEAAERLLRFYGGDAIEADTDLSAVGTLLDGRIPAILAEVVKRAKLAELRRIPEGEKVRHLSADALLEAARTMSQQLDLLEPRAEEKTPSLDAAMGEVVRDVFQNS